MGLLRFSNHVPMKAVCRGISSVSVVRSCTQFKGTLVVSFFLARLINTRAPIEEIHQDGRKEEVGFTQPYLPRTYQNYIYTWDNSH